MSEPDQIKERPRPFSSFVPKILAFHKIRPDFTWGITNYPPKRLERLLNFLLEQGYHFVSLREMLTDKPGKGIVLTFDDGYQHVREYLLPIVEKFQLKPTIFIPTAYIGKPNCWDYSHVFQNDQHLDEGGIREMIRAGCEIGSHGHTHTDLTRVSVGRLEDEMVRSMKMLEDVTGSEVTSISYPFGRCSDTVAQAAKDSGYRFGLTMKYPDESNHAFGVGRYAVYGYDGCRPVFGRLRRGVGYRFEYLKSRLTNGLSQGTVLLNVLRNRDRIGDC